MTNERYDELFNKAYEGGSLDSTEAVELVDELDSAYKRIKQQTYLLMKQKLEIQELRRLLAMKGAQSA